MRHRVKNQEFGWTLPELMLVVAIISLIVSIASPKFSNLANKAREAAAKGNLSALRSALNIYYAGTEGIYPSTGAGEIESVLTAGAKYLSEIPMLKFPRNFHPPDYHFYSGNLPPADTDTGQWLYNGTKITINCSHSDSRQTSYNSW